MYELPVQDTMTDKCCITGCGKEAKYQFGMDWDYRKFCSYRCAMTWLKNTLIRIKR